MAGDNLTVHFFNVAATHVSTTPLPNIKLAAYRPIDVIQIMYQNQYAPVQGSGGTTIWKMGRCIISPLTNIPVMGPLFDECKALGSSPNNVVNGADIALIEVVI
ncbi:MAG: hypothetical protein NTU51_08320 [Bacteroidetes bacterium]|nr:hypothetical protein [Bacteroidota bacterium]